MFKTENVPLVPNILTKMVEDQHRITPNHRPFLRDATNLRSRECRFAKPGQYRGDELSLHPQQKEDPSLEVRSDQQSSKQNKNAPISKLSNLLINFESEECIQEEERDQPKTKIDDSQLSTAPKRSQKTSQRQTISEKAIIISEKAITIPEKNNFLLVIQSDDQEAPPPPQEKVTSPQVQQLTPVAQQPIQQKIQGSDVQKMTQHLKVPSKKQFLLDLQSEDEDQQSQKADQGSSIVSKEIVQNKRMVIRLGGLVSRFSNNYYLEPIPYGAVFESVIKRDRSQSDIKYHLYDCITLRNFMTVIKDSKGYIIVSKFEDKASYASSKPRKTVVGRICSNFFGTEFNCTLENTPYVKNQSYPVKSDAQKVITIQYQTNIFGLNGPRKIAAYIPKQLSHQTQSLNEVYEKEQKKNVSPSVLKFNNKIPKWSKQSNAYVLNFRGRASVSSIKNFIMVDQNDESICGQKVLFGKFGRELFNLDIRYPFSVIQGVALALSSFDRKLACE